MKYLLMTTAFVLMTLPAAAKDVAPGCNPAVQNWANGSGDTCPPSAAGGPTPWATYVHPEPKEEDCPHDDKA